MAQTEAQKRQQELAEDDAVAVIPNTTLSPKITAGALSGVVVIVVVAMLSAITPDMLWWAGRFTPVIYAGVGALVAVGSGYLKKDTSRDFDVPVAALSGHGGVRTDVPAVEAQAIDGPALDNAIQADVTAMNADAEAAANDMTPQPGTPDQPETDPADDGVEELADVTDTAAVIGPADEEVDETPPPAGYEPRH